MTNCSCAQWIGFFWMSLISQIPVPIVLRCPLSPYCAVPSSYFGIVCDAITVPIAKSSPFFFWRSPMQFILIMGDQKEGYNTIPLDQARLCFFRLCLCGFYMREMTMYTGFAITFLDEERARKETFVLLLLHRWLICSCRLPRGMGTITLINVLVLSCIQWSVVVPGGLAFSRWPSIPSVPSPPLVAVRPFHTIPRPPRFHPRTRAQVWLFLLNHTIFLP